MELKFLLDKLKEEKDESMISDLQSQHRHELKILLEIIEEYHKKN